MTKSTTILFIVSFHCVMDMVLLLNIASKPTYSFLYDMYNDFEPSKNHFEQKNKPWT